MPLSTMRALTRSISSSEYLEVHNGTMPATTMKSAVSVDHSSPTKGKLISQRSIRTFGQAPDMIVAWLSAILLCARAADCGKEGGGRGSRKLGVLGLVTFVYR